MRIFKHSIYFLSKISALESIRILLYPIFMALMRALIVRPVESGERKISNARRRSLAEIKTINFLDVEKDRLGNQEEEKPCYRKSFIIVENESLH